MADAKKAASECKAPPLASAAKQKQQEKTAAAKDGVKLPTLASPSASPTKKAACMKAAEPTPPKCVPSLTKAKAASPLPPTKSKSQTSASPKPVKASKPSTPPTPEDTSSLPLVASVEPSAHSEEGITTSDPPVNTPADAEPIAAAAALAATAATIAAEADAEAARLKKENGNGTVQLIYEQYDELFPIVDGSTTQATIDDVYCLSFVMPNCLAHLSHHPQVERFEREGAGIFDSLVHEDPRGVYHDLVRDKTYYVVVEQEADQLKRDQEATKAKWAPALDKAKQEKQHDDGRGFETCSCIYGNPCVDEYGCKDWHSRFAVATANGWKGF